MLKRGGELDLRSNRSTPTAVASSGAQPLECDVPPVAEIAARDRRSPCRPAELALEDVAVTKGVGESGID